MKQYLKCLVLLGIISASFSAHAKRGGTASGGGDAIICQEGGSQKVYLADTLSAVKDFYYFRTTYQADFAWQGAFFAAFKKENPALAKKVAGTLRELTFVKSGELEELEDDNIDTRSLPSGCYKKQLAIQDLQTKTVRYNYSLYKRLSAFEKSFLKLHEAFIFQEIQTAGNSRKIRARIERITWSTEFSSQLAKYSNYFGTSVDNLAARIQTALVNGARVFVDFQNRDCVIIVQSQTVTLQTRQLLEHRKLSSVSKDASNLVYRMKPVWNKFYELSAAADGSATLTLLTTDGRVTDSAEARSCRLTEELPLSGLALNLD